MKEIWQVGGLPLHPLLVHAVLVLLPLTVLAVALAHVWPGARRRLGLVTPLAALGVLMLVPITQRAGEQLLVAVGPIPAAETHAHYARMLLPWAVGLFVVAVAQWVWFRSYAERVGKARPGARRLVWWLLGAAIAGVGGGILVMIVLIGDTGARAVWGSLLA